MDAPTELNAEDRSLRGVFSNGPGLRGVAAFRDAA